MPLRSEVSCVSDLGFIVSPIWKKPQTESPDTRMHSSFLYFTLFFHRVSISFTLSRTHSPHT